MPASWLAYRCPRPRAHCPRRPQHSPRRARLRASSAPRLWILVIPAGARRSTERSHQSVHLARRRSWRRPHCLRSRGAAPARPLSTFACFVGKRFCWFPMSANTLARNTTASALCLDFSSSVAATVTLIPCRAGRLACHACASSARTGRIGPWMAPSKWQPNTGPHLRGADFPPRRSFPTAAASNDVNPTAGPDTAPKLAVRLVPRDI